ncbi:odorant receptor 30a-like [Cataglyphis hispanica]|uniref:odorant receptor 30a-like n=1 Tax=Cataglyphis hispanica TaxID=1086592 RepID=UPI00217F4358|nr:odorant receptor 30a-like [Cataglyphis hispanica]
MARFHLKPQQLLQILEILGVLSSTSPKPISGKFNIIFRTIVWCLTFGNLIFQLVGEMLFIYHNQDDSILVLKTIFVAACVSDGVLNLILCHIQKKRLQYLFEEIENYLQTADKNGINILQNHVNRYSLVLAANTFLLSCAGLIICLRPLITKDRFPVDVWYPSFMDTPFRSFLIYVSQIFAGTECVLCFNTDISIAIFLCYSTARLEVLQHNLESTKTKDFIHACVKEHQDIIKFVELTQDTVQYLILKLNLTMGTAAVCSLFPLIIDQPLAVKVQFIFSFLSACERFYISAWSANDLSEMSKQVAYSSSFEDYMTPETVNDILFIILRSQKPLTISMASFLPVLSLEYFGNFMIKAFSYFTAMNSIINT